jgi:hypothetical protein
MSSVFLGGDWRVSSQVQLSSVQVSNSNSAFHPTIRNLQLQSLPSVPFERHKKWPEMKRKPNQCFIASAKLKLRSWDLGREGTNGPEWRARATPSGIVRDGEERYFERLVGKSLRSRMVSCSTFLLRASRRCGDISPGERVIEGV